MASSTSAMKLTCVALVLCMLMGAQYSEAITCGQVTSSLSSCIGYLKGGPGPAPNCCAGIRTLSSQAKTPADKQTACGCIKNDATAIKGLNFGLAAGLPGRCGVSIPYTISPNTDCSKIH